ncbi:MAG: ATP-binding cassette domain-containing protein [OM182 bacterium]|nr:ATP-binding cassette domain-containing protein [OM182 bacterium]
MTDNVSSIDEEKRSEVGNTILRSILQIPLERKSKKTSGNPLLKWVRHEQVSIRGLFAIALLSASFGTAVVYFLNTESKLVGEQRYSTFAAVAFIVALIAYRFCQRFLISKASESIEAALDQWRRRIATKVAQLSLRDIEDFSAGGLADGMVKHYGPLSQAIVTIAAGVECLTLLSFMYLYLLFLSPLAALMVAVIGVLSVMGYMNLAERLGETMGASGATNARLDRLSEAGILGAKELRFSEEKRAQFLDDSSTASKELYVGRARSASLFAEVLSSGTTASYLMAGSVIFILPIISPSENQEVSRIVMAVLFLIGPIGGVIGSLQQFSVARFSVLGILDFESRVDACIDTAAEPSLAEQQELSDFKKITIDGLSYKHRVGEGMTDDLAFTVSKLTLEIARGSLVFITGGNGSGKTTIMRVLTGLYPRDTGTLMVDDVKINRFPQQAYRNLFSSVFADFYLFSRAYALDAEGLARLDNWLVRLGIRNKLPADLEKDLGGNALSTGQRKRLALGLALAEDRPIVILDEWAADQDPATRKTFYREILPELKAAGKTLIVVTHDDRYFDAADYHYHVEEGVISLVTQKDGEAS